MYDSANYGGGSTYKPPQIQYVGGNSPTSSYGGGTSSYGSYYGGGGGGGQNNQNLSSDINRYEGGQASGGYGAGKYVAPQPFRVSLPGGGSYDPNNTSQTNNNGHMYQKYQEALKRWRGNQGRWDFNEPMPTIDQFINQGGGSYVGF